MRQRDLKFTFVVGEGNLAFDVVEFELEEALCEPFRLNLKLASDKNAIDFKQVLDQPGTFTLWQDGRPARYVHGIVSHFTQGSSGFRRTRYELLLEPQLARLELCCNWRIFQEKSVPEILQALLKEHRDRLAPDPVPPGAGQRARPEHPLPVRHRGTENWRNGY